MAERNPDFNQPARDVKKTLIEYLLVKVSEHDWHAVADAAMDLRELEVEIRMGRK